MNNIIVLIVILVILYLAARPLIKFRKRTGNCVTCIGCSHHVNNECGIKQDYETLLQDIRKAVSK